MRIAVLVIFDMEQCTAFFQKFDDLRIGFEDVLARKMLDIGSKIARRIDRCVNLKPVPLRYRKIVRTMAGSRMYAARSALFRLFTLVSCV